VTIGRAATNKFQISRRPPFPVSIVRCCCEGKELLVRDMRSTNGTFIKGVLIE
jgi:pSer/pThr/pTyr-binding forkhead associated (FHA) protein